MKTRRKQTLPFAVAIGFAVLGGLGLWYFGSPTQRVLEASPGVGDGSEDEAVPGDISDNVATIAQRYARAVQAIDCNAVIDMTLWMRDRLEVARKDAGDPAAAETNAREDLCRGIRTAAKGEGDLTLEGIEDGHVFSRSAQWSLSGLDAGRNDLAKAAAGRAWLNVSYPVPGSAPRDVRGDEERPIKSMRVGVNVSADGYVLKASVVGNVEIDDESIAYYW